MPTGQAFINLIQQSGAIKLTGGVRPKFTVNFAALRAVLQREQKAMTGVVLATGPQRLRTDTGNITLTPPGGNPVNIPIIVMLGADGSIGGAGGLPQNGETVILDGRSRSGHILIAAGGNGDQAAAPIGRGRSDGGGATLIGKAENLLVALGGEGGIVPPAVTVGMDGGDGGDAFAIGIDAGNDLYVQGGTGRPGTTGRTGTTGSVGTQIPATPVSGAVVITPMVASGTGGPGGVGGKGGKASASGGDTNFALAMGGAGGAGGAGGPGGAAVPAANLTEIAVPAGAVGRPGNGGGGGNIKVTLGQNSVQSTACAPGGGGAAAGPATPGAAGVVEP